MSRTPTLAEVVSALFDDRLEDLRVAMPGRVERYDAEKKLADVQPLIRAIRRGESGERIAEKLPVVPNVPVVFNGGSNLRIVFPLRRSDTVVMLWSRQSLDKWLSTGGLVDPGVDHVDSLADVFAIPGLRDFKNPWSGGGGTWISIGRDDAEEEGVGLGETIKSHLDALKIAFDNHTHVAPGGGGVTSTPTPTSPTVPDTASITVKATR